MRFLSCTSFATLSAVTCHVKDFRRRRKSRFILDEDGSQHTSGEPAAAGVFVKMSSSVPSSDLSPELAVSPELVEVVEWERSSIPPRAGLLKR